MKTVIVFTEEELVQFKEDIRKEIERELEKREEKAVKIFLYDFFQKNLSLTSKELVGRLEKIAFSN